MDGTKLTGLWKGKDKAGKTYLSGKVSGFARLLVLPNDYKRTEKDPDFFAYLVPNQEREKAETVKGGDPLS